MLFRKALQGSLLFKAVRPVVDWATGATHTQYLRAEPDRLLKQLVSGLPYQNFDVLEISGNVWQKRLPFKSYAMAHYPEHDVCVALPAGPYDFIVAEHVFEHVLSPYKAAKNVLNALQPGGYFLMVTPFLVGVHMCPNDCTRWTEQGAKYFLAECGFPMDQIQTGSWGNRQCVKANFDWPVIYRKRIHSIKNESNLPVTVWALARKAL